MSNYGKCKTPNCGRFGELREDGQCLRCNPILSRFEKQTGDTPQGEIQPLQEMYKDDVLSGVLGNLRAGGMSYHQLKKWLDNGEERGITHMDIKRAINGELPKSNWKREQMRLPPLVPAPACPQCGEAHTKKTCPNHPSKPRGPRLVADVGTDTYNWVKEEAARWNVGMADIVRMGVGMYVMSRRELYNNNMESSARMITNNLPPATVRELIQNLVTITNG